jgi:hypothetical protein
MSTRALVAALLWLTTSGLAVATFVDSGDPCTPSDWSVWTMAAVGFSAAAATFASIRTRPTVALAGALVAGTVIGGGVWLLALMRWVSNCTA